MLVMSMPNRNRPGGTNVLEGLWPPKHTTPRSIAHQRPIKRYGVPGESR